MRAVGSEGWIAVRGKIHQISRHAAAASVNRTQLYPPAAGTARHGESGFTSIELVLVVAILGILVTFAVPRFTALSGEAQMAATESLAGTLGSAAVMNFAKKKATGAARPIITCESTALLLDEGDLPAGYTIASNVFGGDAREGASKSCNLQGPDATLASFRTIKVD